MNSISKKRQLAPYLQPMTKLKRKKGLEIRDNLFVLLARLEGFGPPTCGLEVRCSIQLSYRRVCAFSLSDKDETRI